MQPSEVRALLNEICELIEGNLDRVQSMRYNITQLSHLENQCKTNCGAGLGSVE